MKLHQKVDNSNLKLWYYELLLKGSIRWPKEGLNLNSKFCKQNREADFIKSKTEAILILKIQYLPI